jgi:predicted ATP-grasp superfamily ATP-dependent carboligase
VLDPADLFEVQEDLPELGRPVLLHILTGFIDAGSGTRLAVEHLLESLQHEVIARFDVDQLVDYRSRRPPVTFTRNRYESADMPALDVHVMRDTEGTPFLLLTGPEPDFQWERYAAAVRDLVRRLDVALTVGVVAIPWMAPHTRPMGVTAHATDPALVANADSWVDTVVVPGSAVGLVELRLGEAGLDAMGFAAHVPHYVAQVEYPAAAATLLDAVAGATELALPTDSLHEAAEQTRAEIDQQVAESSENATAVRALEEQYDALARGQGLGQAGPLPSAEEIGAEFERFLAQQDRRDDTP